MKILRVALAGMEGVENVKGPSDGWEVHLLSALTCELAARGLQATVFISPPSNIKNRSEDRDLTLLMGLNTACEHARLADQRIRTALLEQGIDYQVLYGTAQERLVQAIALVEARGGKPAANTARPGLATRNASRPWLWACDKCSDPQCEHKLLTDLLARRAKTIAP